MRENYCATIIDSGTEGIDRQIDRWTKKKLKKENIQGKTKKFNALFKRTVSSQHFHIFRLQDICQETHRNPSGSPDLCQRIISFGKYSF